MELPAPVKKCLKLLDDNAYDAYVVGGCVRDAMLGRQPHDYDICTDAKHPYTQALFSATPAFTAEEKANKNRILLHGDVPSPVDPPKGCRFAARCRYATPKCFEEEPQWYEVEENHICKCHLFA